MVDVILIVLMLVFAISGYRQGFVIGALSFGGFFSGVLIGLQIGPLLANLVGGGEHRLVGLRERGCPLRHVRLLPGAIELPAERGAECGGENQEDPGQDGADRDVAEDVHCWFRNVVQRG